MSLLPGNHLGPYEILSSLGAGGMGAVYRARDPRLQRDVAIKVLHPDKLTDPGRRQRFLVEAKAVSSLNHPNILTVFDTGTEGEIAYLVTELVDGRSLDALIPSAGFPVSEVLRIATQIADALAKAHAAGIVHRDLKPANVMLTSDGRVKVLDFGLAKILEAAPADEATKTMAAQTAEGTIMGTAGYMSPEQAEGKPLDQRSDIFSFGALLYELATGQRAFAGDSQMSVIAAVLREDPRPPGELRADLPSELTRIIMRCLRKDPARRVQSTADLKVALDELKHESDSGKLSASIPPGSARPAQTAWLRSGWLVAGLGLAAVLVTGLVVGGLVGWRALAPGGTASTGTPQPVPLTTFQGAESWPSFSPDGNQVAFAWNGEAEDNFDIYVKLVGPGTPLRLTTDPAPDIKARWSPDGQKIAFLRQVDSDTVAVLLVSPLGGPETKLGQFYTQRAVIGLLASLCWAADSRHLLVAASQVRDQPNAILRLSIDTREVKTVATLTGAAEGYTNPDLSPDGRTLAAVRVAGARTVELLTLSPSYEVTGARTFEAPGNKVEVVAWTSDGQDLLFSHAVNIPLPLFRASLAGGQPTSLSWTGAGAFWPAAARQSGRAAFTRMARDTNIWQVTLDAGRRAQPGRRRLASSSFREVYPRYSPDGRRLAFYSNRSGSVQIWTADADGSRPVPLTSMSATATTGTPRWSPDGTRILFDSTESGSYQVYVISADGGPTTALTTGSSNSFCAAWSRDGRWIFFSSSRSGEHQVWKVPPAGGAPEQVTRHGGVSPDVSPDGAWLYYIKADGAGGLWRMPIDGGEETQMVPNLFRYNYALTDTGVYYVPRPVGAVPSKVLYRDFATGATTQILEMDKPPDLGLAISSDGRTLLYTQLDYSGQDLMLVENFR